MRKRFVVAIAIGAVLAVIGAIVFVNRNSVVSLNETEVVTVVQSNGDASVVIGFGASEESKNGSSGIEKAEAAGSVKQDDTKTEKGTTKEAEQLTSSTEVEVKIVSDVTAKESESAVGPIESGQWQAGSEITEIELPFETDIPEDWDWNSPLESQSKKQESTTEPSTASPTSGDEEKQGEPEGQSSEEGSTEEQKESEKVTEESGEGTSSETEESGEKTSSEQGESEEQSSEEEGSTEETETEKPTLSPEEQASIVESATAPIELPTVYFD